MRIYIKPLDDKCPLFLGVLECWIHKETILYNFSDTPSLQYAITLGPRFDKSS